MRRCRITVHGSRPPCFTGSGAFNRWYRVQSRRRGGAGRLPRSGAFDSLLQAPVPCLLTSASTLEGNTFLATFSLPVPSIPLR